MSERTQLDCWLSALEIKTPATYNAKGNIRAHIKALRAQLEAVTRERDELRSKLKGTLLVLEPHALDTPMTDLSKILDAHDKAMGEK